MTTTKATTSYPCHAHTATTIAIPRVPLLCEHPITDALDVCPACTTETPRVRIGRFVDDPDPTSGTTSDITKTAKRGSHAGPRRGGAR